MPWANLRGPYLCHTKSPLLYSFAKVICFRQTLSIISIVPTQFLYYFLLHRSLFVTASLFGRMPNPCEYCTLIGMFVIPLDKVSLTPFRWRYNVATGHYFHWNQSGVWFNAWFNIRYWAVGIWRPHHHSVPSCLPSSCLHSMKSCHWYNLYNF